MKIGDYLKYSLILLLSALFFCGLPSVAKGADKTDGGPITITKQPVGQTVKSGENVRLEVKATGGVKLDMIYVPPGTFTMGSPESEAYRGNDETQHQVKLTKGFWLGKYEVTQSQYRAVMGSNPTKDQGKGEGADYPVYNVSWEQATDFCERLTKMQSAAGRLPEGYKYTLPTEAQWEYACRAGTTTVYSYGDNASEDYMWYGENYDTGKTHKVGEKKPNAWGFYDMHGNVWEKCLDFYDDYSTESVTDPKGPDTGTGRVMRGGSWREIDTDPSHLFCRSAVRLYGSPSGSSNNCGFRVALSPVE